MRQIPLQLQDLLRLQPRAPPAAQLMRSRLGSGQSVEPLSAEEMLQFAGAPPVHRTGHAGHSATSPELMPFVQETQPTLQAPVLGPTQPQPPHRNVPSSAAGGWNQGHAATVPDLPPISVEDDLRIRSWALQQNESFQLDDKEAWSRLRNAVPRSPQSRSHHFAAGGATGHAATSPELPLFDLDAAAEIPKPAWGAEQALRRQQQQQQQIARQPPQPQQPQQSQNPSAQEQYPRMQFPTEPQLPPFNFSSERHFNQGHASTESNLPLLTEFDSEGRQQLWQARQQQQQLQRGDQASAGGEGGLPEGLELLRQSITMKLGVQPRKMSGVLPATPEMSPVHTSLGSTAQLDHVRPSAPPIPSPLLRNTRPAPCLGGRELGTVPERSLTEPELPPFVAEQKETTPVRSHASLLAQVLSEGDLPRHEEVWAGHKAQHATPMQAGKIQFPSRSPPGLSHPDPRFEVSRFEGGRDTRQVMSLSDLPDMSPPMGLQSEEAERSEHANLGLFHTQSVRTEGCLPDFDPRQSFKTSKRVKFEKSATKKGGTPLQPGIQMPPPPGLESAGSSRAPRPAEVPSGLHIPQSRPLLPPGLVANGSATLPSGDQGV